MWPRFDSRTRCHSYVGWVCCWFSSLLRGFFSTAGSSVFLPPQKPTFPNSNSIWNPRATGLSVVRLLSVTLVKQSWFIYFFYFMPSELHSKEPPSPSAICCLWYSIDIFWNQFSTTTLLFAVVVVHVVCNNKTFCHSLNKCLLSFF